MPATYLPIKLNRRSSHRARRHKMPARSARTGKFLKRGSAHRSSKRRRNTPKGFHLGRGTPAHSWLRANHHGRSRGAAYYRKKRGSKARRAGTWKPGWAKRIRTSHRSAAKTYRSKKRRGTRRRNTGLARYNKPIRYRTRHVVVHKTKRLRNPVGFDAADRLSSLGTWGKIGLGILFGLGGLVVAFGVPKGLAVVTGKDVFQRGWGGVATSAVASVGVGLLVGLVSKKASLALLTAAGVGVVLLAGNALHSGAAQAVIPVNEAVLAAMLPTMSGGGAAQQDLSNVPSAMPGINAYGLPMGTRPGAADYHPGGFHAQKGPADYYPATRDTKNALTSSTSSYYGNPLKNKERF